MTINIRLIPTNGAPKTTTINGRTHTVAANSFLDVVDFDAHVLSANGWIEIAPVGATSARSVNPSPSARFFDTTLGYTIVWNGNNWTNPATGASV